LKTLLEIRLPAFWKNSVILPENRILYK